MKAIETTATIDEQGQLTLDKALGMSKPQQVRVIILMTDDDVTDEDDTPTLEAIEGIQEGLKEALSGQTLPLSELWIGIDVE
ncbi:MAG: hypothetical protein AAGC93_24380 [Cyanobacteria bacterium P01_F01_bin.53]